MLTRDDEILRHIGNNTVSLRVVIEKLFFEDRDCGHVIERLADPKRRRIHVGNLPGGLSYYQLTLSEARRLGIPGHRAHQEKQPITAPTLRKALAVLWFCCMENTRRTRVQRNQLAKLFGRGKGLGMPHCWEALEGERKRIYRIYTPGPHSSDEELISTLTTDAQQAASSAVFAPWVGAQFYTFAVLLQHPARQAKLATDFDRRGYSPVKTFFRAVPDLESLQGAIREHRKKAAQEHL